MDALVAGLLGHFPAAEELETAGGPNSNSSKSTGTHGGSGGVDSEGGAAAQSDSDAVVAAAAPSASSGGSAGAALQHGRRKKKSAAEAAALRDKRTKVKGATTAVPRDFLAGVTALNLASAFLDGPAAAVLVDGMRRNLAITTVNLIGAQLLPMAAASSLSQVTTAVAAAAAADTAAGDSGAAAGVSGGGEEQLDCGIVAELVAGYAARNELLRFERDGISENVRSLNSRDLGDAGAAVVAEFLLSSSPPLPPEAQLDDASSSLSPASSQTAAAVPAAAAAPPPPPLPIAPAAAAAATTPLIHLGLAKNRIGEAGMAALLRALLSGAFRVQSLERLEVYCNAPSPQWGFFAGEVLRCHPRVVAIDIGSNGLGDAGAALLAAAMATGECARVREVHLDYSGIGADGAERLLAAAPKCPALARVWLHGNDGVPRATSRALARHLTANSALFLRGGLSDAE